MCLLEIRIITTNSSQVYSISNKISHRIKIINKADFSIPVIPKIIQIKILKILKILKIVNWVYFQIQTNKGIKINQVVCFKFQIHNRLQV